MNMKKTSKLVIFMCAATALAASLLGDKKKMNEELNNTDEGKESL